MFAGFGFGEIAKRHDDGFAFVPIGKLIGIVTTAKLPGFARGNQKDGVIPVGKIGDEAHGGAVVRGRGADTVSGAGLRFAGDAEEALEKALAAERMQHIQRIESLPIPVSDARALRLLREHGDGEVGGSGEQFVVIFIVWGQPLRRAVCQNFLEENVAAPLIKVGVVSEVRLEDQMQGGAARHFEEGYERRIRIGHTIPVFQILDKLPCARIFRRRDFRGRQELVRQKNVRIAIGVRFDFQHIDGAQAGLIVEEIVDARDAIRFFPTIGQIWFGIGADDTGIGSASAKRPAPRGKPSGTAQLLHCTYLRLFQVGSRTQPF